MYKLVRIQGLIWRNKRVDTFRTIIFQIFPEQQLSFLAVLLYLQQTSIAAKKNNTVCVPNDWKLVHRNYRDVQHVKEALRSFTQTRTRCTLLSLLFEGAKEQNLFHSLTLLDSTLHTETMERATGEDCKDWLWPLWFA